MLNVGFSKDLKALIWKTWQKNFFCFLFLWNLYLKTKLTYLRAKKNENKKPISKILVLHSLFQSKITRPWVPSKRNLNSCDGNTSAENNRENLEKQMLTSRQHHGQGHSCIFQQDNVNQHCAHYKDWQPWANSSGVCVESSVT